MHSVEAREGAAGSGPPVGAEAEQGGGNAEMAMQCTGADPGLGHAPLATPPDAPAIAPRRSGAIYWVDGHAECYVSPIRNGGMARGEISGMRPVSYPSERLRNAFVASIAARIRAHYEGLPEASQSTPCVDPELALLPNAFEGDAMKSVNHFSVSVGAGSGLSHVDQIKMAAMLHKVERVASNGPGGAVTESFSTPESFAAGVRAEQDRVLAARGWMQVPISTAGRTYNFYHRDLLDVGIGAV